ncbi:hypothetical protein PVAND_009811 [Polypedilum vanderplanki]|uniref:MD-2-related lipid-recognition domain-containing protein n=1 Tax=Polypedilum vanderplanki TaxID=319348 RepID=A0A9J6CED3_POLVA|nr:hypothetical protein PVAND_009811 [Polypedilum vanderplanki]
MNKLNILLIFALIIAPSMQTHMRTCSNGAQRPLAVVIGECESLPCRIKRGEDIFVAVSFKTQYATRSLRPEMNVKKFGFGISMDIPPHLSNACEMIRNTQCPLEVNEEVIYTMNMRLNRYIPAVNLEMEMTFIGDNNRPVTCFALDIQLY